MNKLLDLLVERRRRQAGDDVPALPRARASFTGYSASASASPSDILDAIRSMLVAPSDDVHLL
jgi:hypothetical protein